MVPDPAEEEGAGQADGRLLPVAAPGGRRAGQADRVQRHTHGLLGAQEAGMIHDSMQLEALT